MPRAMQNAEACSRRAQRGWVPVHADDVRAVVEQRLGVPSTAEGGVHHSLSGLGC